MHVLVTDATAALGRLVARQLIAAGHTVSGIAEQPHPCLDRNVEFVCASLRNPVLQRLAYEADAVIHLAPLDLQRRAAPTSTESRCDRRGGPRRRPLAVRVARRR